MNTVRIIRNDSTSPVIYEHVKHAWRQQDELVLSIGEHGAGRLYVHWPLRTIDHYEVQEEAQDHAGSVSGVRSQPSAAAPKGQAQQ